ncbi:MAG TPA: PQQ-binding-like beta-propeller repeat protein [Alphaproteobacteria bacterium]|nr:PQQ-binding-like beta-propeller repeat protein [Alphaproteobacteria bacterium]
MSVRVVTITLATAGFIAGSGAYAAAPDIGWGTNGGALDNNRYARLTQITPENIKSLSGAWRTELPGASSKASPIVVDGVMYVAAGGGAIQGGGGGAVYALDAKTGAVKWTFSPQGAGISALNKGVAVADGKVFVGLSNAHVAAIDAKTGKLVWDGLAGEDPPAAGQFISVAPVVADGKVLVGVGSGDAGFRCRLAALDVKTGKQVWSFISIPGPGEPGHDTWPAEGDAWQHGGGGVWATPAVDLELGLVLFGTGSAYPQYGGDVRPGANLYTASVMAVDLKTGKYKWHFQTAHHEIWESDVGGPELLYDAKIDGKTVKAVAALRTDGYLFLLDRKTGKPIFPVEERPVPQNARLKTWPTQPYPVGADKVGPNCVEKEALPPGFVGACFWEPIDYDQPNVINPMSTRFAPTSYDPKQRLFFVSGGADAHWARRQPNPYFFNFSSTAPGIKSYGLLSAFNADTNKIVWQKRLPWPIAFGGGSTVTEGGVLFHPQPDGNLQAFNSKTGDQLWEFQTGAPANGAVTTYRLDGKDYVSLVSGSNVWAFALDGKVGPLPAPPAPPTESDFSGRIVTTNQVQMSVELENNGLRSDLTYIDEYALKPTRVKIHAGDSVTWTNTGKETHTPTARDGSWTAGPVAPGKTATVKFDKPGKYTYFDKDHPWSIGQLIVE